MNCNCRSIVFKPLCRSVLQILVLPIAFLISCVGPAEPEDGLIENFPAIVTTESVFTFSLRADDYSFEETYNLSFPLDSTTKLLSTTLVVAEYDARTSDTAYISLVNQNDSTLVLYYLNSNLVMVRVDSVNTNQIPETVFIKGKNYTGTIELVLARGS